MHPKESVGKHKRRRGQEGLLGNGKGVTQIEGRPGCTDFVQNFTAQSHGTGRGELTKGGGEQGLMHA